VHALICEVLLTNS